MADKQPIYYQSLSRYPLSLPPAFFATLVRPSTGLGVPLGITHILPRRIASLTFPLSHSTCTRRVEMPQSSLASSVFIKSIFSYPRSCSLNIRHYTMLILYIGTANGAMAYLSFFVALRVLHSALCLFTEHCILKAGSIEFFEPC